MTTVTTYEERETDNEVLRSEHIATKGTMNHQTLPGDMNIQS